MFLKSYVEQNLFFEELLPEFPFLKKGWGGYIISGDGGSIDEKDFKLLKICIDQLTHDSSIKCCLTTFYDPNEASWLSEWETPCDWTAFSEVIDDYSFVSYSGMYFFGSSEKWGGLS